MNINLEEIRQTLEECSEEIAHDKESTNDLVIDELVEVLGYNKRRDKAVKKIRKAPVDWIIHEMAIVVYAAKEEISKEQAIQALEYSKENSIKNVIFTNGYNMRLSRYSSADNKYKSIYNIDISKPLSDRDNEILSAISKDGYDDDILEGLLKTKSLEFNDILSVFINNRGYITKYLLDLVNNAYSSPNNASEQCNIFIDHVCNISNSVNTTGISEANKKEIDEYIEKLEYLNNKSMQQEETIQELNKEIRRLTEELDSSSGRAREKALELMSIIDADNEDERSYVAIINDEIIQFKELHRFVGKLLQKLYELKSFEAHSYIYNGNIFHLRQDNTKYNDMVIGNKAFDILIKDEDEDEAILKLKTIFSHYPDIVFECKKLGHLNAQQQTGIDESILNGESDEDETVDYLNSALEIDDDSENTSEDEFEDANDNDNDNEQYDGSDEQDNVNEYIDSLDIDDTDGEDENMINGAMEDDSIDSDEEIGYDLEEEDVSEDSEDSTEDYNDRQDDEEIDFGEDETDDSADEQLNSDEYIENENDTDESGFDDEEEITGNLLVSQLSDVDKLVFSDDKIDFYSVKYLGSNNVTYAINPNNDEMAFESMLCKCVDAVMAIRQYEGDNKTILKLKQKKDLDQVNNSIKRYSQEYRGYPHINGTKFTVDNIGSIQQLTVVLTDICKALSIDTSEMFIYFDADTDSEYIKNNYSYDEDAVQLREYDMYVKSEDKIPTSSAVIKGDLFNNIIVTKSSLQAHKDIINKTLAVKTKYLAKIISNVDDFVEVINSMLIEAANSKLKINTDSVGLVIGEGYKLISDKKAEVSDNCSELSIAGHTIYCSNVEDWQMASCLIRMHAALFLDAAIAVKVLVDVNAINYYGSEYDTVDPSNSLAIKSLADYIATCIK